jgi:hypothetical protein
VDVGVDEAGQQQTAGQVLGLLVRVCCAQPGVRAAGHDHTVTDQQAAVVLRAQSAGGIVTAERVPDDVQDGAAIERHLDTSAGVRRDCIRAAATETAITAGSLPAIAGRPIGQVMVSIRSGA